MREHAQQTNYQQVRQDVSNDRYNNGQQQSVALIRARTGDYTAKRSIKWIADRNYELYKPCSAARGKQSQQKSHSEQRVDYVKDVIDYLGNASQPA